MRHTLTYSPSDEGWVSFYTFYPEFMVGMNQYLYSFKGGNLYRHNSDRVGRNTFYSGHPDGGFFNSSITTVFNDAPLETKTFKTIELESNSPWSLSAVSELETGTINDSYFEYKEDAYFAFIRAILNVPVINSDLLLRSAQGIGVLSSFVNGVSATMVFNFGIDSIMSVGDIIYSQQSSLPVGVVTDIDRSINTVVVNTQDPSLGPDKYVPSTGEFMFYMKNTTAESNGIRGSFMVATITNSSSSPVEIFAIKSKVFKSYP